MSALLDGLAPAQNRPAPRRRVRALAFLLACAAALVCACAAAPAGADSIVYIHEGNVWVANGDGSGQYQVTLDGSASSPYESPSQSDGGTILAIRRLPGQRNQLFRMTQSGQLLNPPVDTPAPGPAGAIDAKISPDGALAAYWFVTGVAAPCAFCIEVATRTLLTHSDRFTSPDEVGTPHTGVEPSWISDSTILMSNDNSTQWYYTLGMPEAAVWFESTAVGFPETFELLSDGEVAPSGDRMSVVFGDKKDSIWMLQLNGPPPAKPGPLTECFIGPKGQFVDTTWSADGSTLYWQEDDGVWAAHITSPTDCSGEPTLLIPGGREPDASPAALNPGRRPGCGNPGNPTPCPAGPASPPISTPAPMCTSCPTTVPSASAVTAALRSLLKTSLRGLRAKRHLVLRFSAPQAGTLSVLLSVHGRVLARGRHVFAAAGKAAVTLALTPAGRKHLQRAHRLHARLTATFTAAGTRRATSLHTTLTVG